MFGDILTDEASVLAASIGLLPSASIRASRGASSRPRGLFEPIHGSAPDIAGHGRANPAGMILSLALMLRTSLGLDEEARIIERAVEETIAAGIVTADLTSLATSAVSTSAFGDAVAERVAAA